LYWLVVILDLWGVCVSCGGIVVYWDILIIIGEGSYGNLKILAKFITFTVKGFMET